MMTKALTLQHDIKDLATVADPESAARLVCWMGLDSITGKIPVQKEGEKPEEYVVRIWPRLKPIQRQQAVEAGLQKTDWYIKGLADGSRLVVYEAYTNMWVPFNTDGEFRSWVSDYVGGEEPTPSQQTEASRLATTILNVVWLDQNGFDLGDGYDDDEAVSPRDILSQRERYTRWVKISPRMRALIEAANQDEIEGDVDGEIRELIENVNDPEKSTSDLDVLGRKGPPRIPPLVIVESQLKDDLGRYLFYGAATPAQWSMLKQKMGRSASLELTGQEYGIDQYALVEYRFYNAEWAERVYWDDWTDWKKLEEAPDLSMSILEDKHVDEELELTYLRYWEEREKPREEEDDGHIL